VARIAGLKNDVLDIANQKAKFIMDGIDKKDKEIEI
jgi:hypothetical protein